MEQLIEFTNNHLLLVGGTIMVALAVIFYEVRLRAGGVSAVSAAQTVRLINQGARVIDVRDKAQFAQGHIVDAINIPAAELDDDQTKRFKNAKFIILVCDNGAKSGQCAATLKKAGMENTFSLQGGLGLWQRDNLPIISSGDSPEKNVSKRDK